MQAFEQAVEITIHETPGDWCWWFIPTDQFSRFELIAVYKGCFDFIHHGLFFGALDRQDAARLCHGLNTALFDTDKCETVGIIETVSAKLRKIAEEKLQDA